MTHANKEAFSADTALEPYWEAARDGRLLIKACQACGKKYYYPRPLCPFCMSDDTQWQQVSGEGRIYSWSVQRRADPPYAIAFVTLAEGPTLMSAIVDCDLDQLAVDQPVSLKFEQRDGQPVPVFRPA